jgi:hypothetical protein
VESAPGGVSWGSAACRGADTRPTCEAAICREAWTAKPAVARRRLGYRTEVPKVVRKRVAFVGLGALCALAFAGSAAARGGRYVFEGGTAKEHAQVRVALEVSMFNWGLVPATVTIHLHRVVDSYATRGEIWLDTRLVDAGTFSWGTIQHE